MDSELIQRIVREVIRRLNEGDVAGDASPASADPARLVTEDLVKEAIRDGRTCIPVTDATVVTPLARDLLRQSGIRLNVVDAGKRSPGPEPERKRRIAVVADVDGAGLMGDLARWLSAKGHSVEQVGTASAQRPAYVPLIIKAARLVADGSCDMAMTVDGDGARAAIAANKIHGVRSAVCGNVATARKARSQLDANVINLPIETVSKTLAQQVLTVWLTAAFDTAYRSALDQVEGLE